MANFGNHQADRARHEDAALASNRPDYGLDAPGAGRGMAIGGGAAVTLGILAYFRFASNRPELAADLLNGSLWAGSPAWSLPS